jgi:hypothetical protein
LLRERYKKLTEEAAERGGLVGYFRWVAREHAHKTVEYRSVEEVQRDIVMAKLPLRRRCCGISPAADQSAIAKMLKSAMISVPVRASQTIGQ